MKWKEHKQCVTYEYWMCFYVSVRLWTAAEYQLQFASVSLFLFHCRSLWLWWSGNLVAIYCCWKENWIDDADLHMTQLTSRTLTIQRLIPLTLYRIELMRSSLMWVSDCVCVCDGNYHMDIHWRNGLTPNLPHDVAHSNANEVYSKIFFFSIWS